MSHTLLSNKVKQIVIVIVWGRGGYYCFPTPKYNALFTFWGLTVALKSSLLVKEVTPTVSFV